MSSMIRCDSCKLLMFADSRTEKGAYHDIFLDGNTHYHLCSRCFDGMMRNVFHLVWNDDECQYTEKDGDGDD